MNTPHTPGPWYLKNDTEIHDKDTLHDESGARIGNTPNMIAKVEFMDFYETGTTVANARLIAAAPDLLAALESALVVLERQYSMLPDDSPAQDHFMLSYLEPARDAINKVKGVTA